MFTDKDRPVADLCVNLMVTMVMVMSVKKESCGYPSLSYTLSLIMFWFMQIMIDILQPGVCGFVCAEKGESLSGISGRWAGPLSGERASLWAYLPD